MDAIHYEVLTNAVGLVYSGTDEAAADAAWDRWVAYVDNDTALEPIIVKYLVNGERHNTYTGPTWAQDSQATAV